MSESQPAMDGAFRGPDHVEAARQKPSVSEELSTGLNAETDYVAPAPVESLPDFADQVTVELDASGVNFRGVVLPRLPYTSGRSDLASGFSSEHLRIIRRSQVRVEEQIIRIPVTKTHGRHDLAPGFSAQTGSYEQPEDQAE